MPKLAICSDLHLEFGPLVLKNEGNADVLILSGDVFVAQDLHEVPYELTETHEKNLNDKAKLAPKHLRALNYRNFLKNVSSEFPNVIYVAGNHEFYHGKFPGSLVDIRNECNRFSNVHFLEKETKVINDVTFIGCTLWTDMNKNDPLTLHAINDLMNDFKIIRNDQQNFSKFRPVQAVAEHRKSLQYIQHVVQGKNQEKFVVVTHMAPTKLSIHPRYKDQMLMNGGYCSDLSEFILDHPQIKLWTLGHVHDPHSYYMGDTFVACNPRGYVDSESVTDSFKLRYIDLDNLPAKFDKVNWTRD